MAIIGIIVGSAGKAASSGGAIGFAITLFLALIGWIEYGFWATFLSVFFLLILNSIFFTLIFKIDELINMKHSGKAMYFIVGLILASGTPGVSGIIETIYTSIIMPPIEYLKLNGYIFDYMANFLGDIFGTLRRGRSLLDMMIH